MIDSGTSFLLSRQGLRSALLLIMVAAFTCGTVLLAQAFAPGWYGAYLVLLALFASAEVIVSSRMILTLRFREPERGRFRIGELGFIAVIVVLVDALANRAGVLDVFAGQNWRVIAVVGYIALVWLTVLDVLSAFHELDQPPIPGLPLNDNQITPLQALNQRVFAGCVVLTILCGVATFNTENPPSGITILAILGIYLGAGLLLMGRTSYDSSHFAWEYQKIEPPQPMLRTWIVSSLVLLVLGTFLALLLPGSALSAVGNGILAWLSGLFKFKLPPLLMPPTLPEMPPPLLPQLPKGLLDPSSAFQFPQIHIPWLQIFQVIGLIVLVGYIVFGYLRDYPAFAKLLRRFNFFKLFQQLWALLWGELRVLPGSIGRLLPKLPERFRREQNAPTSGYVRLNAYAPREQVYFYYLSALRRAAEQGMPRKPDQTPYEYEQTITALLETPEIDAEIQALTQAFITARYSRAPIGPEDARQVRQHYEQIKKAIRVHIKAIRA